MSERIRIACGADLPAVAEIYEAIHAEEEAGRLTTGWLRGVYPTADTARAALARGDLFVLETAEGIRACAVLNGIQPGAYADGHWRFAAEAERVLVLHTLAVAPGAAGKGLGRRFVAFYEETAARTGRPFLRMDTNARNLRARALYAFLGYREAGIVPTVFNGIPGVDLVLLEKRLTGFSVAEALAE